MYAFMENVNIPLTMKLAISIVLSLILIIAISSTALLIDTPTPALAEIGGDDPGDNNGHDDDGGDDNDHGDDSGHEDDGGDEDDDNGGHGDDDIDQAGNDDDLVDNVQNDALIDVVDGHHPDEIEDANMAANAKALEQMTPPEGQEFGDVMSLRDRNGDIIVTADGVPVLARQLFDKNTGTPIHTPRGLPIYTTNVGRISIPWTNTLGPGLRSGPGYERFKYTPLHPGDQNFQSQEPDSSDQIPEVENQDYQSQDPLPPGPVPGPRNQDGDNSPSEAFDDDTQFDKPQIVIDSTGNPRVNEAGDPVLGQYVIDKENNHIIGPNGKPIIVIQD